MNYYTNDIIRVLYQKNDSTFTTYFKVIQNNHTNDYIVVTGITEYEWNIISNEGDVKEQVNDKGKSWLITINRKDKDGATLPDTITSFDKTVGSSKSEYDIIMKRELVFSAQNSNIIMRLCNEYQPYSDNRFKWPEADQIKFKVDLSSLNWNGQTMVNMTIFVHETYINHIERKKQYNVFGRCAINHGDGSIYYVRLYYTETNPEIVFEFYPTLLVKDPKIWSNNDNVWVKERDDNHEIKEFNNDEMSVNFPNNTFKLYETMDLHIFLTSIINGKLVKSVKVPALYQPDKHMINKKEITKYFWEQIVLRLNAEHPMIDKLSDKNILEIHFRYYDSKGYDHFHKSRNELMFRFYNFKSKNVWNIDAGKRVYDWRPLLFNANMVLHVETTEDKNDWGKGERLKTNKTVEFKINRWFRDEEDHNKSSKAEKKPFTPGVDRHDDDNDSITLDLSENLSVLWNKIAEELIKMRTKEYKLKDISLRDARYMLKEIIMLAKSGDSWMTKTHLLSFKPDGVIQINDKIIEKGIDKSISDFLVTAFNINTGEWDSGVPIMLNVSYIEGSGPRSVKTTLALHYLNDSKNITKRIHMHLPSSLKSRRPRREYINTMSDNDLLTQFNELGISVTTYSEDLRNAENMKKLKNAIKDNEKKNPNERTGLTVVQQIVNTIQIYLMENRDKLPNELFKDKVDLWEYIDYITFHDAMMPEASECVIYSNSMKTISNALYTSGHRQYSQTLQPYFLFPSKITISVHLFNPKHDLEQFFFEAMKFGQSERVLHYNSLDDEPVYGGEKDAIIWAKKLYDLQMNDPENIIDPDTNEVYSLLSRVDAICCRYEKSWIDLQERTNNENMIQEQPTCVLCGEGGCNLKFKTLNGETCTGVYHYQCFYKWMIASTNNASKYHSLSVTVDQETFQGFCWNVIEATTRKFIMPNVLVKQGGLYRNLDDIIKYKYDTPITITHHGEQMPYEVWKNTMIYRPVSVLRPLVMSTDALKQKSPDVYPDLSLDNIHTSNYKKIIDWCNETEKKCEAMENTGLKKADDDEDNNLNPSKLKRNRSHEVMSNIHMKRSTSIENNLKGKKMKADSRFFFFKDIRAIKHNLGIEENKTVLDLIKKITKETPQNNFKLIENVNSISCTQQDKDDGISFLQAIIVGAQFKYRRYADGLLNNLQYEQDLNWLTTDYNNRTSLNIQLINSSDAYNKEHVSIRFRIRIKFPPANNSSMVDYVVLPFVIEEGDWLGDSMQTDFWAVVRRDQSFQGIQNLITRQDWYTNTWLTNTNFTPNNETNWARAEVTNLRYPGWLNVETRMHHLENISVTYRTDNDIYGVIPMQREFNSFGRLTSYVAEDAVPVWSTQSMDLFNGWLNEKDFGLFYDDDDKQWFGIDLNFRSAAWNEWIRKNTINIDNEDNVENVDMEIDKPNTNSSSSDVQLLVPMQSRFPGTSTSIMMEPYMYHTINPDPSSWSNIKINRIAWLYDQNKKWTLYLNISEDTSIKPCIPLWARYEDILLNESLRILKDNEPFNKVDSFYNFWKSKKEFKPVQLSKTFALSWADVSSESDENKTWTLSLSPYLKDREKFSIKSYIQHTNEGVEIFGYRNDLTENKNTFALYVVGHDGRSGYIFSNIEYSENKLALDQLNINRLVDGKQPAYSQNTHQYDIDSVVKPNKYLNESNDFTNCFVKTAVTSNKMETIYLMPSCNSDYSIDRPHTGRIEFPANISQDILISGFKIIQRKKNKFEDYWLYFENSKNIKTAFCQGAGWVNVSNSLFLHPSKHVLHVIKKTPSGEVFDADLKVLVTQYMYEYMPDIKKITSWKKSNDELRFDSLKIFELSKTPGGNKTVGKIEFQARAPYYADGKTNNGYLFFYQEGIGIELNSNVRGFGGFVSVKKLSNKKGTSKQTTSPKKSKLKF